MKSTNIFIHEAPGFYWSLGAVHGDLVLLVSTGL